MKEVDWPREVKSTQMCAHCILVLLDIRSPGRCDRQVGLVTDRLNRRRRRMGACSKPRDIASEDVQVYNLSPVKLFIEDFI